MCDLQITVTSERIGQADATTYIDTLMDEAERRCDRALEEVPVQTILHDTDIWRE